MKPQTEKYIMRPIPGYNCYYASDKGLIYSKKTGAAIEKVLYPAKDGYYTVGLTPTGSTLQIRKKAHRMVALAWLENPDDLPFVNHKDGNKTNNAVSNLEWISAQGNVQHAFDTGLVQSSTARPVYQLNMDGEIVAKFESLTAAEIATGITARSIQQVCCGRLRVVKNFGWVYQENYVPGTKIREKAYAKKVVEQYFLDGDLICEYESVDAAARDMGVSPSSLAAACRGEQKTCQGYIWKYKPKEEIEEIDPEEGTEDWVILDEFPLYKISRYGDIYSIRSKRIIEHSPSRGRRCIGITDKDGVSGKKFVHQLVAQAYIENPNDYPIVNHLDGNPLNNNVDNLEWATHSMNGQHAYDTNLNTNKTRVMQLSLKGEEIQEFDSVAAAGRSVGVTAGAIHYVLSGKGKQCKGFKWRYA
jgi:hypothetical protein